MLGMGTFSSQLRPSEALLHLQAPKRGLASPCHAIAARAVVTPMRAHQRASHKVPPLKASPQECFHNFGRQDVVWRVKPLLTPSSLAPYSQIAQAINLLPDTVFETIISPVLWIFSVLWLQNASQTARQDVACLIMMSRHVLTSCPSSLTPQPNTTASMGGFCT